MVILEAFDLFARYVGCLDRNEISKHVTSNCLSKLAWAKYECKLMVFKVAGRRKRRITRTHTSASAQTSNATQV